MIDGMDRKDKNGKKRGSKGRREADERESWNTDKQMNDRNSAFGENVLKDFNL